MRRKWRQLGPRRSLDAKQTHVTTSCVKDCWGQTQDDKIEHEHATGKEGRDEEENPAGSKAEAR